MSGRTLFTERNFTYTPNPSDDATRALLRWEMQLQRQLDVGDVTRDAAAKQAAMDISDLYPVPPPPAPAP